MLATVGSSKFLLPVPKRLTILLGHPQRTARDDGLTEADIRALIGAGARLRRGLPPSRVPLATRASRWVMSGIEVTLPAAGSVARVGCWPPRCR